MIIVFTERAIKHPRSVPGKTIEELRHQGEKHPISVASVRSIQGFPLYPRRVSVRLASALPAAEPKDTRTQSRDLTLNPAAGC
ncbi:hypothetical protein R3I93_009388 [Phoxinus phoxinus]|uniref:Uncharacterized protein n=1 Tax=Phoxinus phoxinus TaxID=58324 RepID=A0AAN9H8L1_9TELE